MDDQDQKTIAELWEFLHAIDKKLEVHLAREEEHWPKVEQLIEILNGAKYIKIFLQGLVFIGAPIWAFIEWSKDHIKF